MMQHISDIYDFLAEEDGIIKQHNAYIHTILAQQQCIKWMHELWPESEYLLTTRGQQIPMAVTEGESSPRMTRSTS